MRSRRMARLMKVQEQNGGSAVVAITIGIFIARSGGVTGSCPMQPMDASAFGWCSPRQDHEARRVMFFPEK